MQTPAGYATAANGQFVPADWLAIVFSPSFPYRLVHTVFAAYLTTALAVGAGGAWHLLRDPSRNSPSEGAPGQFSMGMGRITGGGPFQILGGRQAGLHAAG